MNSEEFVDEINIHADHSGALYVGIGAQSLKLLAVGSTPTPGTPSNNEVLMNKGGEIHAN